MVARCARAVTAPRVTGRQAGAGRRAARRAWFNRAVSTKGFEHRVASWCAEQLGSAPVARLMAASQTSQVFGVRLADGREVAVKARADATRRAATCVQVQLRAAQAGFPCALPLTPAVYEDGTAVHAEQWRPGGQIMWGAGPRVAGLFGRLYARLASVIADLEAQLAPPLPNPEWVRWDHGGSGPWPANWLHDSRPGADELPRDLVELARRARARLLAGAQELPRVFGHADWETQNLRWDGGAAHTVHDWDSVAWQPEAALVGAGSGSFSSDLVPTLAPVASSESFIAAYERERGRVFEAREREVAWAASLWPALHNARRELLWQRPPVALEAVAAQGEERLRRAGA